MTENTEKSIKTTPKDARAFLKKISDIYAYIKPYLCKWIWVLPPIIVFWAMMVFFHAQKLYPFGGKSISWGDMDQQYVPLLLTFKDVLAGKEGFFYNVKHAAGMNFYGVFFYFLSSPFTFLIMFVDKADMNSFVNVLIMLKMCAIAGTASYYLSKKYPSAPLLNVFLSVLYAYSGYSMMYYQIIGWLDVVYLFPLLLLGLERLKEGKKALFILTLAASIIVNFYLGYMLVIFLLLYVFIYLIMTREKRYALDFCVSCFVAALLSAIVWLPSFLQYFSSGRTTELLDNLAGTKMLSSYQTTLQTVFSMLFLFPFALMRKEEKDTDGKLRYTMFLLTLVPILIEPINKMWQTGNYMCFPTRYSFITLFLCITLAMDAMTKKMQNGEEIEQIDKGNPCTKQPSFKDKILKNWQKTIPMYVMSAVLLVVSIAYYHYAKAYTAKYVETMDQYSHSLWGNDASFAALFKMYALALAVGVLWYVFYKYRLFKPVILWLSVGVLVCSELYVAPMTYMSAPVKETTRYEDVVELENVIDDDGFYRVKTNKEYSGRDFDVNHVAGIGYHALGHFTSLTNDNYMTAIKQFGYTSYWMEVGNSGGTILSDALMSVKYEIGTAVNNQNIYKGNYYTITPTATALPLGIITNDDVIAETKNADYTDRAELQKILAQDFFGYSDFVTTYTIDDAAISDLTIKKTEKGYKLTPKKSSGGKIIFEINPAVATRFYFNVFDENSNALNQSINEKFSISAPKASVSSFPTKKQNGLFDLGEYNAAFKVTITVLKTADIQDIGIVGIETGALLSATQTVRSVGMRTLKNGYKGTYQAEGGECVFLSVPYDSGLRLKINGKRAEIHEIYDGFIGFYLKEGKNEIKISYRTPGFIMSVGITLIGAGLFVALCPFAWRKRKSTNGEENSEEGSENTQSKEILLPNWLTETAYWGLLAAGAAVIFFVYLFPLMIAGLT